MITRKRSDQMISRLVTEILKGEKGAGGKLPSTGAIAKEYGVSTASVREMIKTLETIGIVTVAHGTGVKVEEPKKIMSELLEARRLIEGYNAGKAALNHSPEDIEELETFLVQMDDALKQADIYRYSELDYDFHLKIARLSDNQILQRLIETLKLVLYIQQLESNKNPSVLENSNCAHKQIIAAVKSSDPDAARQAMLDHLDTITQEWETRTSINT